MVDQEVFARVRTRATQVALEGSVLASEFTRFYAPLDLNGARTDWASESFILPVRMSGQQTLSVLSVTLPIEVETEIANLRIDGENFGRNRAAALASDATMLRDTDDGFRYLKKDKDGNQVAHKLSKLAKENTIFLFNANAYEFTPLSSKTIGIPANHK